MHAIQDLAMTNTRRFHRHRQAGRSLIELLIALVIGFVVLGAVMMTSINANRTSSVNQQVARMQQDATFATQLLTGQLRLAGYSAVRQKPVIRAPIPNIFNPSNRNYAGPPVVGCENGFANLNAADYTLLACNGGAANTAPDAISIIYEGDAFNTFPTAGNPGQPTDCLGATVAPTVLSSADQAATSGDPNVRNYARIENRYYIVGTTLFCQGNGNPLNPQPVLDNVVDMQIVYGVANTPQNNNRLSANDPMNEAVMHMRADQVNNQAPFPAGTAGPEARWNRAVSATVCLLLRSDLGALDQPTPYTDCQGNVVNPPAGDTRAYRQVRIQVGFKNRTPACLDASPGAAVRADRCDILL
jgi:type IV pilus assembly protein PilW